MSRRRKNRSLENKIAQAVENIVAIQRDLATVDKKGIQIERIPKELRVIGQPFGYNNHKVPQSDVDYLSAIEDPLMNSALAACLNWIIRTFPEAPITFYRRNENDKYLPEEDHPLTELIKNPNPFYDDTVLWMGTMISWVLDGNAYWLKQRNKVGEVTELWYVPHHLVEPIWPLDGSQYISHYLYMPYNEPTQTGFKIKPENIVHLRYGFDTINHRKGMSQIRSVLREIFTDNEASNFAASLLKNMGVPGVVISPADPETIIEPDAGEEMKANFKARFNGDNRGEPMVMSANVKVTPVSLNPQQMDLKGLHRLPEERISAVLGIPAIVAGLGAGLEAGTMSNFKEAREMAYESNIIPTQRIIAKQLERQLFWEFEEYGPGIRLGFDLRDVRVLQDDMNAKYQRLDIGVRGGWLKRSEARAEAGFPVMPEDETYLSGGNLILGPEGNPIDPMMLDPLLAVRPSAILQPQLLQQSDAAQAQNQAGQVNSTDQGQTFYDGTDTAPEPAKQVVEGEFKSLPPNLNLNEKALEKLAEINEIDMVVFNSFYEKAAKSEYHYLLMAKANWPGINSNRHLYGYDAQNDVIFRKSDLTVVGDYSVREALSPAISAVTSELQKLSQNVIYEIEKAKKSHQDYTQVLEDWVVQASIYLKGAHLITGAATMGGWSQIGLTQTEQLKTTLLREFKKLADFAQAVLSETEELNNLTRLDATSAWGTYFNLH